MGTKFAVGDGRARGPKPKSAEDKLAALDLSGVDSCEQGHPFSEENTRTVNGRWGVWRQCKICANRRSREWHEKNQAAVVWYKTSRPCADCGGWFPSECVDFDHVRGIKRFNASLARNHPMFVIWEEIQKCDVVCSNCHRIRTSARRKQNVN